ncbi:HAMP domain-containing histidine kinase [Bacillaceae bacterium SIJ1]|uniref:sensor histidine kinase n=1 Tax=Litoribacterium kuwaitense TaxID=1398745 RepID=UPI0013EAB1F0|nr:HAMP domain-containing sensor histidine kinase [Litoribacterium kuwaitense]NGP45567.1 HAMP domain-containing histidine kinase [Litoribacterium kuwaitense]
MTFVYILFVFLLILFIYKSNNTSSVIFLYGIFISAVISYLSFVLYLSKFNLYYGTINELFNLSPGTRTYLVLQNFDPNTLIRLLNVGNILFYLFIFLFSLSFCMNQWLKNKKTRRLLYIVIPLSVAQFLFFDPAINLFIQDAAFSYRRMDTYLAMIHKGEIFFKVVNLLYVVTGIFLLVRQVVLHYHIRFLRNHTLFTIFSLLPLMFIYFLMFYWAPDNLVKSTFIPDFINYQQPDLTVLELRLYPMITTAALLFMFYNAYKYNMIKRSNKEFHVLTHRNIDTASLGVRTFTHSIKNHLLAIHSEAEFLQERLKNDAEAMYSLKLITHSCLESSRSLETALEKLSGFHPSMAVTPLNAPVLKACHRFKHSAVNMETAFSSNKLQAHIDEDLLEETIYNLIKNAEEAVDAERGEITVTTKRIHQWGVISITDNGSGISNEAKKRLFTPFYSTKSSVTNWGIGLSYCYKVIKLHGGTIEFHSKYGEGAQFNIFIPLLST